MSLYAYADSSRNGPPIHINDIQDVDTNEWYYCPNKECQAHLYVVSRNGIRFHHFAATRKRYRHIEGCFASEASRQFSVEKYTSKGFDPDSAIAALATASYTQKGVNPGHTHIYGDSSEPKPPRTISQIYWMCKSFACTQEYGPKAVGEILLDNRSIHMYPNGVTSWHLIEAKCNKKLYNKPDEKNQRGGELLLHLLTDNRTLYFVLQFNYNDRQLFRNIKDKVYNNQDKTIVVAGDWKTTDTQDTYLVKIVAEKQILIIK